ncbi:MAG: helix-turn-helix domain-containing protein [Leptolyngbyaceae cyanobacterium]
MSISFCINIAKGLGINETFHGQLAAMLSTVPETLSRAFYKLDRGGIITIQGRISNARRFRLAVFHRWPDLLSK